MITGGFGVQIDVQTGALRLTGAGIQAVRGVLDAFAAVLAELPARIVIEAMRRTEVRISEIRSGRLQPQDAVVVEVGT